MILVTGATGFLGSYLVRYLVRQNFKVRALKRATSDLSLLGEAKDRVEWAEGDVTDIAALEEAFKEVTKVYHVASVVALSASGAENMMLSNVEGTANVVNLALEHNIEKLLYVSSSTVFKAKEKNEPVDEEINEEKEELESTYGVSKFLGEREVWRGIAEGLNAVIANPTTLIGAGRWSESSTRLFEQVAKGQLFYPNGSNGYADVRDAAKILIQLMESDLQGERYIINAENRTFRDMIFEVADKLGVKRPPFAMNNWVIPVGRAFDAVRSKLTGTQPVFTADVARITASEIQFNNKKIKTALNFTFAPVSQAIDETVKKFIESKAANKPYAILEL